MALSSLHESAFCGYGKLAAVGWHSLIKGHSAVGINSALPPLAEDMYMVVCHGHGGARERFIVRMGKALNQALYDERNGKADYTEQLGYALLSVPEGTGLLHIRLGTD